MTRLGHGVTCVDQEIQDQLFHLDGIGFDGPWLLLEPHDEFDMLRDRLARYCGDLPHRVVEAKRLGSNHALAREGKQLPNESGRMRARLQDVVHPLLGLWLLTDFVFGQHDVIDDDR